MPKVLKKPNKSKFYTDNDFITEFLSPNKENFQRKRKMENVNNDDFIEHDNEPKRNKSQNTGEVFKEKVLEIMRHQINSGKQGTKRLTDSLTTLLEYMEGDLVNIKENEQRLQQLNLANLKFVQQVNKVNKERVECLKEILSGFQKQCEEQELNQQNDYKKLETDLATEIKMLHEKLIKEARREELKNWHKNIVNAMENFS